MDTLVSKPLCEELYILTKWGGDCETDYYYDKFGHVRTRSDVIKMAKRKLPSDYIPAYGFGFLLRKLPAHETPEDLMAILCIELVKQNLHL